MDTSTSAKSSPHVSHLPRSSLIRPITLIEFVSNRRRPTRLTRYREVTVGVNDDLRGRGSMTRRTLEEVCWIIYEVFVVFCHGS